MFHHFEGLLGVARGYVCERPGCFKLKFSTVNVVQWMKVKKWRMGVEVGSRMRRIRGEAYLGGGKEEEKKEE